MAYEGWDEMVVGLEDLPAPQLASVMEDLKVCERM